MKSRLLYFGPGYTLFTCKFSQHTRSQMLWSAESAGFTFDTLGSDSGAEPGHLMPFGCPGNAGGPHGVAGLIKACSARMSKLAQNRLCLCIRITPFFSSSVCPKTTKKGTASRAETKFLLVWTMYFHSGSGVTSAAESYPLPPAFQACTMFWN